LKKNEHFRHLLLFAFSRDGKDAKAAKAARDICTEKMLCQKERLDGGFHASKTKNSNLRTRHVLVAPLGLMKIG
jgi:hypothetical protein